MLRRSTSEKAKRREDTLMARALLIEPSVPLLADYADFLASRGFDIYTARGANEALALLTAVRPEVTALDVDLQELDGFKLIRAIRDQDSRCLVVSERDDPQDRVRALALGADDYVIKPFELEELFLRLRNMLANRPAPASETQSYVLDVNGLRIDLMTRALLTLEGKPGAELTTTEFSVLRVLAEKIDRVVRKDELFAATRSASYSDTTRSLDVAISRLRVKLRSAGAHFEVRSVRQAGYILSRAIGQRSAPDAL